MAFEEIEALEYPNRPPEFPYADQESSRTKCSVCLKRRMCKICASCEMAVCATDSILTKHNRPICELCAMEAEDYRRYGPYGPP